ncbi:MAG: TonB-dependent receptor [Cytophagales bacterium]|nr:TonB-dependent receptor [Cytophagales bacterium]MDW8383377.1 TonB-dependent receptor [Flammeovirgaceae bacterium]
MKKIIFLLPLVISIVHNSYSQNYIKGIVLEETSNGNFLPIVGASVYWLGTTQGTVTDTNGIFQIPFSVLSRHLVVSFVGYVSDTIAVFNPGMMRVILKTQKSELKEIDIMAEYSATFQEYLNPILVKHMTEKELFKAACCNLSESFETNPSVDVAYSDAVSGTKQIELLGLAGAYTQITAENMPFLRGIATYFGLSFIPGAWIESIQLSKGVGSVVNGFESIAGQINVELRKPETADKGFFNLYGANMGRIETNLNIARILPKAKWSFAALLHASKLFLENDMNNDKFLDIPKYQQLNAIHRWTYTNQKGLLGQFGFKLLQDNKTGGTLSFLTDSNAYSILMNTVRLETFGKVGYVFEGKKYKSVGLQSRITYHDLKTNFGKTFYNASQKSIYLNFIYQSIISNTNHKFRVGSSWMYDDYSEHYQAQLFHRREIVAGVFGEYTFNYLNKFQTVVGLRNDFHNLFGFFVTPRLHVRYAIVPNTVLRISAGRGQRTANIFAENTAVLASSRKVQILHPIQGKPYGLNPEVAWNYGLSVSQDFTWQQREGNITFEFFRTDFKSQVVVDYDASPQQLLFYNLSGISFSNSVQAECNYELLKGLNIRLAYRYLNVKTTYRNELLTKPFVAPHRSFLNISYQTRNRWQFDYTVSWISAKRLPKTFTNPQEFQIRSYSPSFFIHNAQVTKSLSKKTDIYAGGENIFDFRQLNPIIAAQFPYSPYFDASIIWAPVIGRMLYVGFRSRW